MPITKLPPEFAMKRLELLDYGRFLATISVMAFHYLFNGISNGKISTLSYMPDVIDFAKYGYLGVEFFFMISGYVIFFSAKNKTASGFAVSRAVRLYPAFWVAVIFTAVVAQFWGGPKMSVSALQVIANLTMIPNLFGFQFVDGVYWTLLFELKFYLLVTVGLMLGLQSRLELLFLIWPFAMLLALIAGQQHLPYSGGYYCYFSAGAVLAIQKNKLSGYSVSSLLIALYLCIAFSCGMAPELSVHRGIYYSPYIIGFIVAAQYAFFLFLNSSLGSGLKIPWSRLAGGLTYPVYLIHAHFGYMFLSRFARDDNRGAAYLATLLLVLGFAYLIHEFVERRNAGTWHAMFSQTLGRVIEILNGRLSSLARAYVSPINRTHVGRLPGTAERKVIDASSLARQTRISEAQSRASSKL